MTDAIKNSYDFIIAGGGTAGLVLASRLSEDANVSVLVVEAGSDRGSDPLTLTPGLAAMTYGKEEYDWGFLSAPQHRLGGRRIAQARGKCLGGTSSINFMWTPITARHGIDLWEKLGNKGWAFKDLEPYIAKFATVTAPDAETRAIAQITHFDDSKKGDGPVTVSFGNGFAKPNEVWMKAFDNLGLLSDKDYRSGEVIGAFQNGSAINNKTKTRCSSQAAYLTHAVRARGNLTVLTDTLVSKVTLEKNDDGEVVATGIMAVVGGASERSIKATREVIVSAGVFQSPQILELSGIGSRSLLETHGIPVLIENSNVGEHLQDHPVTPLAWEVHDDVPSADIIRDPAVQEAWMKLYMESQDGPLSHSNCSMAYVPFADGDGVLGREARKAILDEALAESNANPRLPSTKMENQLLRDDILADDSTVYQYTFSPHQIQAVDEPESTASYMMPFRSENYFTMIINLHQPFSRGSCHITSPDIHVKPTWDPNFLENPADLELQARALMFAEKLRNTAPLSSIFKKDGQRCPRDMSAATMEGAKEIVRRTLSSAFHPSSSCAMLPRELGGVVDERLRVYGVKGLRVCDASVFPLEPVGNPMTTIYSVAERAADMIKADWK